ncbi:hypothetical protein H5T58_01740 [Candidatus Parcubacteria bacterium]|nr:hypothetical protein [Candidatus Parcubacteria bacterium]
MELLQKNPSITKIFLFFIIVFTFFTFWRVERIFAINNCNDGWQVNVGATKQIQCHGVCKKVTNNCSKAIFVPTKTSVEWAQFRTNKPNCVSLSECCQCTSGLCCDGCNYYPSGTVCEYGYDEDWRCNPTGCGGTAQRGYRNWEKRCTGTSADCPSTKYYTSNWQWENYQYCSSNERCVTDNATYAYCSYDSSCAPSCTDECSYSGQTGYRCSGNYVQQRTCGYYDSDPCLDWSSWSDYQNCDSYDGCSGTTYYDYYCSGGSCTYSVYYNDSRCGSTPTPTGSLSCQSSTQNSITLSYSFSNSTTGQVSLFRGSTRLKTFSGTSGSGTYTDTGLSSGNSYTYYLRDGTSQSSSLLDSKTCSTQSVSCTRANPTVSFSPTSATGPVNDYIHFTFYVTNNDSSGCGSSLFEIKATSCPSPLQCGSYVTDYISPGQTRAFSVDVYVDPQQPGTYTFTYRATNTNSGKYKEASATAKFETPLDLTQCPEQTWGAGVWGNPDVGWFASAYSPCTYARCRLGTSCNCETMFEGITTGSNTFRSYGPVNSRRTQLCKIGDNANNIPTCPFSGGSPGHLYIINEKWGWSSDINNWCMVSSSGCHKQSCNILGECENTRVWPGEYAGECYYSWGVLTTVRNCYVCVVK